MNPPQKFPNRAYNNRESNVDAPYKRMNLNTRSASPRPFNSSDGKSNFNSESFNTQDRRTPESWNHSSTAWPKEASPKNSSEKAVGNGEGKWRNSGDPWGSGEVTKTDKDWDKPIGMRDKSGNNGGKNWGNQEPRERGFRQKEGHQQYDERIRKDKGFFQQKHDDAHEKNRKTCGIVQSENGRHQNGRSRSPQNRYQRREECKDKTSIAKKTRYDFPPQILIEYSFLDSPHKCIKPDNISKLINPQSGKEDLDEAMTTISSSNELKC